MFLQKNHIHLGVQDADRSAVFYEALLGAPPVCRSPDAAVFELESPPLVLTLERVARERTAPRAVRRSRDHSEPGFSLLVIHPRHVADAAIALRRVGIRLRLEDEGIEAEDPDGNAWQVRLAPARVGPSIRGPLHGHAHGVPPREERHR